MSEQSILICRACTYPLGLRWPMRRGGTDGGCQNCGNDTHLGEFSAQDGHGIISRQAARIASLEQANAELRGLADALSEYFAPDFDTSPQVIIPLYRKAFGLLEAYRAKHNQPSA